MNVIVVLVLFYGIFSSSGPAPDEVSSDPGAAGVGAELVIATMRPGGDRDWDYQRCRPSDYIAEEPCA